MRTQREILFDALSATVFVVLIGGATLAAVDYLLVLGGEQLLELMSVLPPGWANGNKPTMIAATVLVTLPAVVALAVWQFRRAIEGERELDRTQTDR